MKVKTNAGQAKQERTRKILITPKSPCLRLSGLGQGDASQTARGFKEWLWVSCKPQLVTDPQSSPPPVKLRWIMMSWRHQTTVTTKKEFGEYRGHRKLLT